MEDTGGPDDTERALAGGLGGWIRRSASVQERIALVAGGLSLFYASWWSDAAGFAITAVVLILHIGRCPVIAGVER